MSKLIRTLNAEVKVIDAKLGIVDYIASDESLDSYNEIVRAKGWKFTRFAKNAPFVNSHDYSDIRNLLGKVIDFKIADNALIERVQWALTEEGNTLADWGFRMTRDGFLKAVSVGFIPLKATSRYDSDQTPHMAQLVELGIDPTKQQVNRVFLEQEQIELSKCIIGANPNALAKAHSEGCLSDADLSAMGFDDDGMTALHDAAAIYSDVSPQARRLLDLMVLTLPKKNTTPETDKSAAARALADESRGRANADFLREFKKTIQSN